MPKLTISEAAKLTPHNRQTLYKHAKEGKLTTTKDALGKVVVDTAELQRVYGNLNVETSKTPETDDMRQSAGASHDGDYRRTTPAETPEPTALVPTVDDNSLLIETLQSQVKFLSTQLEVANQEKAHLLRIAENQVLSVARHHDDSDRVATDALPKPEPEPEKKSWWFRLRFNTLI